MVLDGGSLLWKTVSSRLLMYERLLEGDDAQQAAGKKQSYDEALEADDGAEAKTFAPALFDLRIANQENRWLTCLTIQDR
jgi:hypothetical protein